MDWGSVVPVVGLVLLLCCIVPVTWIYARRRWLSRDGGIFDAELNVGSADEPRWVLGMARLSGDDLEWFPVLAVGMRPAKAMSRGAGVIRARTDPDSDPLGSQRIMRLEADSRAGRQVWELALHQNAVTGLLAWLEAAPPSVGRFTS